MELLKDFIASLGDLRADGATFQQSCNRLVTLASQLEVRSTQ